MINTLFWKKLEGITIRDKKLMPLKLMMLKSNLKILITTLLSLVPTKIFKEKTLEKKKNLSSTQKVKWFILKISTNNKQQVLKPKNCKPLKMHSKEEIREIQMSKTKDRNLLMMQCFSVDSIIIETSIQLIHHSQFSQQCHKFLKELIELKIQCKEKEK